MNTKYVYTFGDGKAEGKADMRNLLGGKGANLAEMNLIGLPVPAGFTITTEVCTIYNQQGKDAVVKLIENDVKAGIAHMEHIMNAKFGSKGEAFPLMVSVRSGARVSMPGMMDTVLNLGLNDDAVQLLAEKSGNARFAWDSYRRFIQMYGDVVMGVTAAKGEHNPFEVEIDKLKEAKHIKQDTEFTVEDLQVLVGRFKEVVKSRTGKDFPTCPWEQLWGAICAVFDSWMTERAVLYRQLNQIPEEWGTAVNVQAMVYGNMGESSATGVARTAREFLAERKDKSLLRSLDVEKITSKDIYDAATKGDKLAIEIFHYTGRIMGEAFANFVAFSAPEAIILFGGLARSKEFLTESILDAMNENLLDIWKGKIRLLYSTLKDSDAAILGASALAWEL